MQVSQPPGTIYGLSSIPLCTLGKWTCERANVEESVLVVVSGDCLIDCIPEI